MINQADFTLYERKGFTNKSTDHIVNFRDVPVFVYFRGEDRVVYLPKGALLSWTGFYEYDKSEEVTRINQSINMMIASNHTQFMSARATKLMNTPPSKVHKLSLSEEASAWLDFDTAIISDNRETSLEEGALQTKKKCTCGAESTFGPNTTHSSWCDKT